MIYVILWATLIDNHKNMFNQFFGEEGSKKVSQWTAISLMLLSAFLLVRIIGDFKRLPNIDREIYPQSTINVSGTGEVYAIPDIASFSFSVVEIGEMQEKLKKNQIKKSTKPLKLFVIQE